MCNLIIGFVDSNGTVDSSSIVTYFQQAVDWGIQAAGAYLSFLGATFLVVRLFSSK